MSLSSFALESHVDEALRLFQVSTLNAALSGSLSGAEGFTNEGDQEEVRKIERQLKNRFPIGSHVSEQRIMQDLLKKVSLQAVPQYRFSAPSWNFSTFMEP